MSTKYENLPFTKNDFDKTLQYVRDLKQTTVFKMVSNRKLTLHRMCLLNNTLVSLLSSESILTEAINTSEQVMDWSTQESGKRNLSTAGSDVNRELDNSMGSSDESSSSSSNENEKNEDGGAEEKFLGNIGTSNALKRKRSGGYSSSSGPKKKFPRLNDSFSESSRKSKWQTMWPCFANKMIEASISSWNNGMASYCILWYVSFVNI